jgi:hypothetical protein
MGLALVGVGVLPNKNMFPHPRALPVELSSCILKKWFCIATFFIGGFVVSYMFTNFYILEKNYLLFSYAKNQQNLCHSYHGAGGKAA